VKIKMVEFFAEGKLVKRLNFWRGWAIQGLSEEETHDADETCMDCGREYLAYVVRDATWHEAGLVSWDGSKVCPGCLTERLGRELRATELLAWHEVRGYLKGREEYFRRVLTVRPTNDGKGKRDVETVTTIFGS
jgi:hypothetical protein